MVPGEEHNRTKKKKKSMSASDLGNKDVLWGCCLAAFWGQFCSCAFKHCPFSCARTEVSSCPPPQVNILTAPAAHLGTGSTGLECHLPASNRQRGLPSLRRARTPHPLLQSPCTAPIAASPFSGLTYCRGCFKEASEMTRYHCTWDKRHGSWQVGAGARGDKDHSCSHN